MYAEKVLEFTRRIFHSATQRYRRYVFLHEISRILFDFSACDALEIIHKDGDLCYRWQAANDDRLDCRFEIIPDFQATSFHIAQTTTDRLCALVIDKNTTMVPECFTENGAFWTNHLDRFCAMITPETASFVAAENKPEIHQSMIIVPFGNESENRGLLLFKKEQPGFFEQQHIAYYEEIAETFGLAAIDQQAQAALQERVKELTCLYSIARIAQQQQLSMESKLRQIVNMLPPSWQYSDLAVARILLDGTSYETEAYREGPHRQAAEIVINGENRGRVELVYVDDRPELKAVPFLPEEASLIKEIARQIGAIVEKVEGEQDKALLQEQLLHADRLATLGQLAAGVAHEINEPLGNILGFAQLAQKNLSETKQVSKDLTRIEKASLQAREITRNMLIFARQVPTSKTTVDLNVSIREVLAFFRSRCIKAGIEVSCKFDAQIPGIKADPAQINQLLVNLLVNAIHAMPTGGKLTLETAHDHHSLFLKVIDTGTGIAEDIINRIFDPFFTTKEVDQGTGLGLSVVHGIVTGHQGRIDVESSPGTGTGFTVILPLPSPLTED